MKQLPKGNNIWTRVGKEINPLNIQNDDVSIIDVVHALPLNPMFGGFSRKFYSMAEHSVNMHDYFCEYSSEVMEKFNKKPKKSSTEDLETPKNPIADIGMQSIRKFTLLYYAPMPFLTSIIGGFESFNYHYARVAAAIIQNIGLEYEDFKACKPILDYLDAEVKNNVYSYWNVSSDRYLFKQPFEAQQEFISRFNRDDKNDIQIRIVGQGITIVHPKFDNQGQAVINFNLPTITI